MKTVLPSYILGEDKDVTPYRGLLRSQWQFHFAYQVSQDTVAVQDRTKNTILKHMKTAIAVHNTRSFVGNELIADNEFACIKKYIITVLLNLMARSTVAISKASSSF